MKKLLLRFDTQFSDINGTSDELLPPSSIEALSAIEKELRIVLPDDFRQFYLWHDGQKGGLFLFGKYRIYSLSTLLETNKADHRKENPKWIQFGDNGGNTILLVNLDSENTDDKGEILEYFEDDIECNYKGIKEFLEDIIQEIESGELVWDELSGSYSSIDVAPGVQSLLRERVQAVNESSSVDDIKVAKIGDQLTLVGMLKPNFRTNKHMLYIQGGAIRLHGDIGSLKLSSRGDYPLVRAKVSVGRKKMLFGHGKPIYEIMTCVLLN